MKTEPIGSTPYSLQGKRVWVAGHNGMVGSALVRRLEAELCHVLTVNRSELDLKRLDKHRALLAQGKIAVSGGVKSLMT